MATIDDQVEESADDTTEHQNGVMNLTANDQIMGKLSFKHSGQIFDTLISGLSGVTITDSFLTWRARETDSGSFICNMFGEDSASPTLFTSTSKDLTDRVRTAASVLCSSTTLGNWTIGDDKTLTVTSIIQELVDNYDPSAIALLCIHASGNGVRLGHTFNSDQTLAPKLHITYTTTAGDATLVAVAAEVSAAASPDSTFTAASALVAGSAAVVSLAESPNSSITSATSATLVAAIAAADPAESPAATFIATSTLTAASATVDPAESPAAILVTDSVTYVQHGVVERRIVRTEYGSNTVFHLEVVMKTDNATLVARAKLVNVTDGVDVAGSDITTSATTATRVRSPAFGLTGDKVYRVDFGGLGGATYSIYSSAMIADWSI